ncbi:Oxygen sensor protein DosP [compost metagenome]
MNLSVVAEGVETREQLDRLAEQDCDKIQGYYFSRPLPPQELEAFLADWEHDPGSTG